MKATALKDPLLRHYNKLDGLRFLQARLRSVRNARVLPYRVYTEPSQFSFDHFLPRPERFLVRTNLDGEMRHGQWSEMPREDAKPQNAFRPGWRRFLLWRAPHPRVVMERMKAKWSKDKEGQNGPLQFIVHPVEAREATRILGGIQFTNQDGRHRVTLTVAIRPNPTAPVWRNYHMNGEAVTINPGGRLNHETVRRIESCLAGLEPVDRQSVARGLLKSIRVIRAHLDSKKPFRTGHYLEANFSVDRDPVPVFYDATLRD